MLHPPADAVEVTVFVDLVPPALGVWVCLVGESLPVTVSYWRAEGDVTGRGRPHRHTP